MTDDKTTREAHGDCIRFADGRNAASCDDDEGGVMLCGMTRRRAAAAVTMYARELSRLHAGASGRAGVRLHSGTGYSSVAGGAPRQCSDLTVSWARSERISLMQICFTTCSRSGLCTAVVF